MVAFAEKPSSEISEQFVNQFASEYLENLPNQEVANDQTVLVAFSGVPASGKSTLAKQIEQQYQGVRVSTDEIRALIKEKNLPESDEEKHELMKQITTTCLSRLTAGPNHLLILDASIDRVVHEVRSWCEDHNYQFYCIAISLPRQTIEERTDRRIAERQIEDVDSYKAKTEKWHTDQQTFLETQHPEEVLTEGSELQFTYPLN